MLYPKTIACCAIALSSFCAIALTPQNLKVLKQENLITQLKTENAYWIINDSIHIADSLGTITIGNNSVLDFRGGFFSGGAIAPQKTGIKAAQYYIFRDTKVEGSFQNDMISAFWFGKPGDDIAPMVNKAIQSVNDTKVANISLGGGQLELADTIFMDNRYVGLYHSGRIVYKSNTATIAVRESDVTLSLNELTIDTCLAKREGLIGTAITMDRHNFNSNINVQRINGFDRAFSITPIPKFFINPTQNTDHADYSAGISYNKITFNEINARYGFYIDQTEYASKYNLSAADNNSYIAYVTENQINGGVIHGDYGIFYAKPYAQMNPKRKCESNGMVFSNISFGDIRQVPITVDSLFFSHFNDIHFGTGCNKCSTLIDIEGCSMVNFNVLSNVPYRKVRNGKNIFGVYIDGAIIDDNVNIYRNIDRIAIFSEGNLGSGPSTKYLTSTLTPYNMCNTIEVSEPITPTTYYFTLQDLMVKQNKPAARDIITPDPSVPSWPNHVLLPVEACMLNNLCHITVKKNQTFKLDLSDFPMIYHIPLSLIINLADSSAKVIYRTKKDDNYGKLLPTSGLYRLTCDDKYYISIEKIG